MEKVLAPTKEWATFPLYSDFLCTFLEVGTGNPVWMIYFSIPSLQTNGTKLRELRGDLPQPDTVMTHWFTIKKCSFSEELISIRKDTTIYTLLTLTITLGPT